MTAKMTIEKDGKFCAIEIDLGKTDSTRLWKLFNQAVEAISKATK